MPDPTLMPPFPVPSGAHTQTVAATNDSDNLNTIRAISLTAAGVVALFSYFFHIEYFPLFDVQAASSYVFAVAYVMAFLLVLLALALLVPCFLIGIMLMTRKRTRIEQKLTVTIMVWMGFGMLSLIGFSVGVLLSIWLKWEAYLGLLIGLMFSLLLCAVRTHVYVKKIKKKYSSSVFTLWKKRIVRRLFFGQMSNALLISFLQLVPLFVFLLIFSRASGLEDNDYLSLIAVCVQGALFIAFVGGLMLHIAFIPRYRKHWWIALSLILVLPFLLNIVSLSTGMLPMAMAQVTKIGNFRAEKLVLSSKACASIAPILGMHCDEKSSPPIELCNAHIMSRVGPETYLRIAAQDAKDGKYAIHRILLPTADIMSMQVNFDIKLLRLRLVDDDLGGRSSACDATLTTLRGDSAFGFNDFALTDSGKAQLLTFVQDIRNGARGIEAVKVTGHSDQIGSLERNKWLSERRAQEVKLFMENRLNNVAPEVKINATSVGSAQPLVSNCGDLPVLKERIKCEAPNRRVELEIIRKTP